MKYYLPTLRQELSTLSSQALGVEGVAVEDANEKFNAELAIPCFAFASTLGKSPEEIAHNLAKELKHQDIEKIEATSGFANIWLKPSALTSELTVAVKSEYGRHNWLEGKEVVVEHTDANPFKELHIGHIYSNTVGESLCRLYELAGATVHRVSYHGDVGLHIAKALWALGNSIDWDATKLETIESPDMGSFYARGTNAYEDDEATKSEVVELNKKIYERSDENINAIYDWGQKASFDYFDEVYKRYRTNLFDYRFLESQSGPKGQEVVDSHKNVFEDSDGAVVYRGSNDHTRVFINSQGLPTYEPKDLGLALLKLEKYPNASTYTIITANEISAYFQVVLEALKQIDSGLAAKINHLPHGLVKLPDGKMSSRSGDVILATELLDGVEELLKSKSANPKAINDNALAAIKYAFLKQNIGGNIVYNPDESVNLEGQTGLYVQYAGVRIKSILSKIEGGDKTQDYDWQDEKKLLLLMAKYPETTRQATEDLAPHKIAQYVYELAREFNRYYESTTVKDAPAGVKGARLKVIEACLNILTNGLGLLNISVPEKM